ncbi:hypothetical protein NPIL_314741, partial [Nephila pilipes]
LFTSFRRGCIIDNAPPAQGRSSQFGDLSLGRGRGGEKTIKNDFSPVLWIWAKEPESSSNFVFGRDLSTDTLLMFPKIQRSRSATKGSRGPNQFGT